MTAITQGTTSVRRGAAAVVVSVAFAASLALPASALAIIAPGGAAVGAPPAHSKDLSTKFAVE